MVSGRGWRPLNASKVEGGGGERSVTEQVADPRSSGGGVTLQPI